VAVLFAVVAAVSYVLVGRPGGGRFLDPDDTSFDGSRALVELLRDHGVTVDRVDTPEAAVAASDPGSLLLVSAPWALDDDAARRLARIDTDRIVVGTARLDILAPQLVAGDPVPSDVREPDCDLTAAATAGSAYLGGAALKGGSGCYPADGGSLLAWYARSGRIVTVLANGAFMTNRRLDEDGNAALALNLAGARRHLVWQTAPDDPALSGPGDQTLVDLIPSRVGWAVGQLAIAVVLVALWRGRRLGPVVTERLPVPVRASETVEGRGRLYRSRRAHDRAAAALRMAAADRLARALGLPGAASAADLVPLVAARTRRSEQAVWSVLYGDPPADDGGLVDLADRLDDLEREVRDS